MQRGVSQEPRPRYVRWGDAGCGQSFVGPERCPASWTASSHGAEAGTGACGHAMWVRKEAGSGRRPIQSPVAPCVSRLYKGPHVLLRPCRGPRVQGRSHEKEALYGSHQEYDAMLAAKTRTPMRAGLCA